MFICNWTDDDLQIEISAYKNGDHRLNTYAPIHEIPKAVPKRHANERDSYYNGIRYSRQFSLIYSLSFLQRSIYLTVFLKNL